MSRKVVYPPTEPPPAEIVIIRDFRRSTLVFYFSWGESYKLSPAQARQYLHLLGDPHPDTALDLIWNFHAIHYTPETHESQIVPKIDAEEVVESLVPELVA